MSRESAKAGGESVVGSFEPVLTYDGVSEDVHRLPLLPCHSAKALAGASVPACRTVSAIQIIRCVFGNGRITFYVVRQDGVRQPKQKSPDNAPLGAPIGRADRPC